MSETTQVRLVNQVDNGVITFRTNSDRCAMGQEGGGGGRGLFVV